MAQRDPVHFHEGFWVQAANIGRTRPCRGNASSTVVNRRHRASHTVSLPHVRKFMSSCGLIFFIDHGPETRVFIKLLLILPFRWIPSWGHAWRCDNLVSGPDAL